MITGALNCLKKKLTMKIMYLAHFDLESPERDELLDRLIPILMNINLLNT